MSTAGSLYRRNAFVESFSHSHQSELAWLTDGEADCSSRGMDSDQIVNGGTRRCCPPICCCPTWSSQSNMNLKHFRLGNRTSYSRYPNCP
jgi:hypothetical protein